MQEKVREFHIVAGAWINDIPNLVPDDIAQLRIDLITEELTELADAIEANDIVEIADALGDLLYVIFGTAVSYGLDMTPIFNEVHRSNMTKFPNGEVIRGENGKILKPDTFEEPDLANIIINQICTGKEL